MNDKMLEILKLVAPGTELREGLENILKAKTGALIVVSDSEDILKIADGGFKIDEEFTSTNIYELAKMDGAIILSSDLKRIIRANVQLNPDFSISTRETGTRHKTAERVAKQSGELVISISERRGIITLFKGNFRYVINDTQSVLMRANQTLQALEKYKTVFDNMLSILSEHEFDDIVTLDTVINCIYRSETIMRMETDVKRSIIELGDEGRIVNMQLEELMANVEDEEKLIIQDYNINKEISTQSVLEEIRKIDKKNLIVSEKIVKLLGYEVSSDILDTNVSPKGYRILSKVPKMPSSIIEKTVEAFGSLQHICSASIDELDDVEGIGEIRARIINQSLKRLQEQYILKSYNI
ncbi:MAG: DNA integrity scanning diadenylate cyclase DisA [Christensenellales bacterium]